MVTTVKSPFRLGLLLLFAIKHAASGHHSGILSSLYHKAAQENRPLVLVLDKSLNANDLISKATEHSQKHRAFAQFNGHFRNHRDHRNYQANRGENAVSQLLQNLVYQPQNQNQVSQSNIVYHDASRSKKPSRQRRRRLLRSNRNQKQYRLGDDSSERDREDDRDRRDYRDRKVDRDRRDRKDDRDRMDDDDRDDRDRRDRFRDRRNRRERDRRDRHTLVRPRDRRDRDRRDQSRDDRDNQDRDYRDPIQDYRDIRDRNRNYRDNRDYRNDRDRVRKYRYDRYDQRDRSDRYDDRNRGDRDENSLRSFINKNYREVRDRDVESGQRILRSSVIKQLLRYSKDLNCDAQDECADVCDEKYLEKEADKCVDECEIKFECDDDKEVVTNKADDCDFADSCADTQEDNNPSTRGVLAEDKES